MTDHDLLLTIQELLDGVVWSPDTLDSIAELLRENGYRVRDKHDQDVDRGMHLPGSAWKE